jgi:hypothetical protein
MKMLSCSIRVAFKYLASIFEDTEDIRRAKIASMPIVFHSLDNYQQYHAHAMQVSNKAGIMHAGMVFNIILPKEYLKPMGTVYSDPNGYRWEVLNSKLDGNWICQYEMRLVEFQPPFLQHTITVKLPLIGWTVESMPGLCPMPALTYIKQEVPHSLYMRVPWRILDKPWEGVLQKRTWITE